MKKTTIVLRTKMEINKKDYQNAIKPFIDADENLAAKLIAVLSPADFTKLCRAVNPSKLKS